MKSLRDDNVIFPFSVVDIATIVDDFDCVLPCPALDA